VVDLQNLSLNTPLWLRWVIPKNFFGGFQIKAVNWRKFSIKEGGGVISNQSQPTMTTLAFPERHSKRVGQPLINIEPPLSMRHSWRRWVYPQSETTHPGYAIVCATFKNIISENFLSEHHNLRYTPFTNNPIKILCVYNAPQGKECIPEMKFRIKIIMANEMESCFKGNYSNDIENNF